MKLFVKSFGNFVNESKEVSLWLKNFIVELQTRLANSEENFDDVSIVRGTLVIEVSNSLNESMDLRLPDGDIPRVYAEYEVLIKPLLKRTDDMPIQTSVSLSNLELLGYDHLLAGFNVKILVTVESKDLWGWSYSTGSDDPEFYSIEAFCEGPNPTIDELANSIAEETHEWFNEQRLEEDAIQDSIDEFCNQGGSDEDDNDDEDPDSQDDSEED